MEYSTQKEKLILPEYGRNIQRMVAHALTLTNRDERNRCSETIVAAMMQLHPELDSDDKRHTFYDHLALMSDFQLDIDYPYGPPQPEEMSRRPQPLTYSDPRFPLRHYGKIIQEMIAQATRVEDIKKRKELTVRIGNHLKYTYLMWNRPQVDDAQIKNDIERMSDGLLTTNFPEFALLPAERLMVKQVTAPSKKKKKKK